MTKIKKAEGHPVLDNPDTFAALDGERAATVLEWIRNNIQPRQRMNAFFTSYGLKHYTEPEVDYLTNGQFKGAMLAAGFRPRDPLDQNWVFAIEDPTKTVIRLQAPKGVARLVAVAIVDGAGLVWSLPAPARHHHVIWKMGDEGAPFVQDDALQGFVDEAGVFRGRIEAAEMAIKAGQVSTLIAPPKLYSEDLW